jgi:hypothetical protein
VAPRRAGPPRVGPPRVGPPRVGPPRTDRPSPEQPRDHASLPARARVHRKANGAPADDPRPQGWLNRRSFHRRARPPATSVVRPHRPRGSPPA